MKKKPSSQSESFLSYIKKTFENPRIRLAAEGLAVLAIGGVILSMTVFGRRVPTEDLKEGVAYIKTLESNDTAATEKEIKELDKAERKQAMEDGEVDPWQQLADVVILGDSRAVGFYAFGFLDSSRVLAAGGDTIRNIEAHIPTVEAINPSSVFLCYGLNDINIGLWDSVDAYIEELDQILEKLRAAVPESVIYVNSIIPASDYGVSGGEHWIEIPDWNEKIKEHCMAMGQPYVDISPTVAEHADLYDPGDGVHMQKEFYPYWAYDMIMEIYEYE